MARFVFTGMIERDGNEIEVDVAYTVSRYYPATLEQPEEGGEIELLSVKLCGVEMVLSDAEEAEIMRQCEERAGEDVAEEAAAAAEYRAEMRADDRLMGRAGSLGR